jgi:hypothetical protein
MVYLDRKIDQKFGETEKLFSDPNDLRVKENQFSASVSSSTSIPNQIKFPELVSKELKNLRGKVRGEILKEHKL